MVYAIVTYVLTCLVDLLRESETQTAEPVWLGDCLEKLMSVAGSSGSDGISGTQKIAEQVMVVAAVGTGEM